MRTVNKVYNANGKLDFYFTYEYNGDLSKVEKRGSHKKLQRTYVCTYNSKGLTESVELWEGDENPLLKRMYYLPLHPK